jgi:hypothetical protein
VVGGHVHREGKAPQSAHLSVLFDGGRLLGRGERQKQEAGHEPEEVKRTPVRTSLLARLPVCGSAKLRASTRAVLRADGVLSRHTLGQSPPLLTCHRGTLDVSAHTNRPGWWQVMS